MALIADEVGCAEQLAKFFPKVLTLGIPVRVVSAGAGQGRMQESTVLEYGAEEIAIFVSTLPIEFNDRVRILRKNGKTIGEAKVIALQYHEGRKAVAVRFEEGAGNRVRVP